MKIIFFGFVLAYNPFYLYYLMANGALGGTSIRAQISGSFLCFAVLYKVFTLLTKKSPIPKPSPILLLMICLFILFLAGLITGFLNGNELMFLGLDAFPLIELFCLYFLIRLTPEIQIDYDKLVNWVSIYMLLMCICDMAIYFYLSFVQGIGFGALRANVNGIVVNRLMDFIVPILGPGLIVLSRGSKSKFIRILLPICVLLTVGLTFFRTAYVAFFAGFLILLVQERKYIVILFKAVGVAVIIGLVSLFVIQQRQGAAFELDIVNLASERFASIFDSQDDDFSIYSRVKDNAEMIGEVPNNPIVGHGLGGSLDSGAIQFYANYFLQLFLLLGIPGGVCFVLVYLQAMWLLFWLARTAEGQKEKLFFIAIASGLAGLASIWIFFPYNMYFPLLYLFGIIVGVADICGLRRKKRLSLKTEGLQ